MVQKQLGFRADVEGLRGVAVLLVVFFHAEITWFGGGFVGVDVFFVISGYLITGLLTEEMTKTGRIDFARFYARRARRLMPAATLTILVTLVGGFAVLSPFEAKELSKSAFAALFFSSNICFIKDATDYFAPEIKYNAVLHTWSLGVEEQFYLFWPILVFLAVRYAISSYRPILIIGCVSAISLALCIGLTSAWQPLAFFAMPTRAWQFGVGALAYLFPWRRLLDERSASAAGWLGGASILGAGLAFTEDGSGFPGPLAAVPTLGAMGVLVAGEFAAGRGVGRILTLPFLQWTGRLSYAWYLWHWPALAFVYVKWPQPTPAAIGGAVLVSLTLAALTHVCVENPIRLSRYLAPRTRVSLAGGAAMTVAAGMISLGAYWSAKLALAAPEQREIAAAATVQQRYMDCVGRALDPSVRECSFGDVQSNDTIVLFGDSHAMQWLPTLEAIATKERLRLVTLNKTACPAAEVPVYIEALKRRYYECETWRSAALRRIVEMRPFLVVVSSSVAYVKSHANSGRTPSLEEWSAGIASVFEQLSIRGIPTVMIRDNPIPGHNVAQCLSRAAWHRMPADACSVPRSHALDERIFEAERTAVDRLESIAILDFSNEICERDICPAARDGLIIYRDSNHLSDPFVRSLMPVLEKRLNVRERRRDFAELSLLELRALGR